MTRERARWGVLRRSVFWTGIALLVPTGIALAVMDADRRPEGFGLTALGGVCGLLLYWGLRLDGFVGRLVGGIGAVIGVVGFMAATDGAERSALFFTAVAALIVSAAVFHRERPAETEKRPSDLGEQIEPAGGRVGVPPERAHFSVAVPTGWTAWTITGGSADQVRLYEGRPGVFSAQIELTAQSSDGKSLSTVLEELKRAVAGGDAEGLDLRLKERPFSIAGTPAVRVVPQLGSSGRWGWVIRLAGMAGYAPRLDGWLLESRGWIYGATFMTLSRHERRTRPAFDEVTASFRWE